MPKKRPKRATKAPEESAIVVEPSSLEPETTSQIASGIFTDALVAIRKEIRGISEGSIDPSPHDRASRIAWLAERASKVFAEQRKADKSELDAIKKLSAGVIMQWIKAQTIEFRARLVRDVAALDARDRKSVLG